VFIGLTLISIKECQSILKKTITWTQKNGKGLQRVVESLFGYRHMSMQIKIVVKTKFASKMILF
jgi:hypothetical protein